jgi:hypothetical protein
MSPDEASDIIHALGEAFRAGDVDAVTAQFATEGDVIYAGSERGEVALGLADLRSLLADVFARDERYSWRCDAVRVASCAAGFAVLADATLFVDPYPDTTDGAGRLTLPYRVSGLLESENENWRWRTCHGSEPVSGGEPPPAPVILTG